MMTIYSKLRQNHHRLRWIVGLVLAASLAGLFMGYHPFESGVWAEQRVLRVVMDDNYPPYVFRDGEGTLVGILIDQWSLWSKKTGVKVEITAKDWADAQAEMRQRKHDVIDTIFRNPERENYYDFSKPYVRLDTVIFFHQNLPGATGLQALKGFNVGVKGGGHSTTMLKNAGVVGIIEYKSYEEMILAARDRGLLVFVMEKRPGLYFLYKHGLIDQIRFSEPLYFGEFHRAVHKGENKILQLVEEGFSKISRAENEAIEKKWFGSAPTNMAINLKQLLASVTAVVLLAILLIAWNWTLRRTVRKKTAALSMSEKKYRELLINLAIGVVVLDVNGRTTLWNTTALAELSLDERELTGETKLPLGWYYLNEQGERLDTALLPFRIVLRTGEALRDYTMGLQLPDGNERWFQVDAFPDYDDRGRIEQIVVTFFNITTRRETEKRLIYISFHDALTGLYNRSYFEEELKRLENRRGGSLAVAIVDVDGLKRVNDAYGHSQGDELLVRAARILKRSVRHEDIVARIGGDEFAILLRNTDEAMVRRIFERLQQALETEKQSSESLSPLSLSFGYAFAPGTEISPLELFKTADNRMYQEKSRRRKEEVFKQQG